VYDAPLQETNRDSVIRLLGALLTEQDEVCTTRKHYVDMTTYWRSRSHPAEEEELQHTALEFGSACICQTSKVQTTVDTVGKFLAS
jgi:hypothetical protein